MKFDVVFSNPPYTNGLDIKILDSLINVSDEIVAIHPSTWIIDYKYGSKSTVDFRKKINSSLKSLEMFNGNPVFKGKNDKSIGLYVPIVITHILNNYDGDIELNYFDKNMTVSNIFDVSKYTDKWLPLVKPFAEKMKTYESLNDKKVEAENPPLGKLYVQMARIRGHVNLSAKSNSAEITQDDFYTMVMQSSEKNKGIRKTEQNPPTFAFDTEEEQNNFIEYLKTDFARFCLSTQDLQNYMRDFLPDYYGIRK